MVKVLDASSIVLFLEKKPGYEHVGKLFLNASENKYTLLMTSVNWGEVRYIIIQRYGEIGWQRAMEAFQFLPVSLVNVDQELVSVAGDLKIKYKIGYCDALAAALAKIHNAECVTTDNVFNVLNDEIKINLIE